MKREDIKVGVRVRSLREADNSYGQVGVIMDNVLPLLWVKFDDDEYNNILVPSAELGTDVDTRCKACYYKLLEVI